MQLAHILEKDAVPFRTLEQRYGALLALVRALIGVVPNCDPYLEIWPPAFRTYNVMVPNFLNLPVLVWGMGAPKAAVGLGMYVASRAAGCPYCSAHACSFALRRGATPADVAASAAEDDELAPPLRAVARVARALGRERAVVSHEDRAELERHYRPEDVEWIVLAIAMMGWLNKTMDALGIPLELSTAEEVSGVITASGWDPTRVLATAYETREPPGSDTLALKLGLVRHAPSAVLLDRRWTAGVPHAWPAVGAYLQREVGHAFPILRHLKHKRAVRAIATMLRDNLRESVAGRELKLSVGLVYAETVGAAGLAAELRGLGAGLVEDGTWAALARAIAPSPSALDDALVERCRALPPAAIVEVVTFVALLQLLQRLSGFYERGAEASASLELQAAPAPATAVG
jgi:hypothetical protein